MGAVGGEFRFVGQCLGDRIGCRENLDGVCAVPLCERESGDIQCELVCLAVAVETEIIVSGFVDAETLTQPFPSPHHGLVVHIDKHRACALLRRSVPFRYCHSEILGRKFSAHPNGEVVVFGRFKRYFGGYEPCVGI